MYIINVYTVKTTILSLFSTVRGGVGIAKSVTHFSGSTIECNPSNDNDQV